MKVEVNTSSTHERTNPISLHKMMSFNDDEPIVAAREDSGSKLQPFIVGKTMVKIINIKELPLGETKLKVLVEMTGTGSNCDRPGVDIVTVLDVSQNMKVGKKLENMKNAMQFLIQKLSSIDRLSVVAIAQGSKRLCPLRQMNEKSKAEIKKLIYGLVAVGETANIRSGLKLGLKVLDDRILTKGRVAAILILSNGDQSTEAGDDDATQVSVKHVPVYTFGFGHDFNAEVLDAIAKNSKGGTFSVVDFENTEPNNLSIAFSQCLAGLLTVVVQDLKLTVTQVKSHIYKVNAGNYPQSNEIATGSLSVSFGNVYNKEIRKVMVHLLLPAVPNEAANQVLQITYSYSVEGKPFQSPPIVVSVTRTGKSIEQQMEAIETEENRLQVVQIMKEAMLMADNNQLDEAQDLIVEAQNMLEDVTGDEPNPSIEMLKYELLLLLRLMQSQQLYTKKGLSFALAFQTCHARQRFAARGHVEKLRLFATPRMDVYLDQVGSFEEDQPKLLPTANEDAIDELNAKPFVPIVVPLCYHLAIIIQSVQSLHNSLKSIQDVLSSHCY